MIGHREAQALISARLDGPLDPAANRELVDHLAGCPECRAFAEQMHLMSRGLRDMPLLPPSPTVRRAVYDHITNKRPAWSWLPMRGQLAPLVLAALLALVITGTVVAFALPRFQDDGAVRIGAPVIERGTTVAVVSATETPTAEPTATPPPAETATATAMPTETATVVPTETVSATAIPRETEPVPTARATLAIVFATETTTAAPADTATATLEPTATPLPRTESAMTAQEPTLARVPPREMATPVATATNTATAEPTATPTPDATATSAPTEEPTATEPPPTATATTAPQPTATEAPPTATATDVPTETATPTLEPTATEAPATETATATDVPTETATMTPEPTIGAAGAPTIAPRGGAPETAAAPAPATATEETPRSVRPAREDAPTATASPSTESRRSTVTPRDMTTQEAAPETVEEPTAVGPSPTPTCGPAADERGAAGGMPTIAPMDGASDVPGDDASDCVATAVSTGAAEATLDEGTRETTPDTDTDLGTEAAVAVTPAETAAIVEVDAPTSEPVASVAPAPTESLDTGPPATETPAPVVPDVPSEVATEPARDGVTVPSRRTEAILDEETAGNVRATGTGEAEAEAATATEAAETVNTESTRVDGLTAAGVILAGLPSGNAAGGPLLVSPDGNQFVLGGNGEQRWIVGFDGTSTPINGTDVFYPIWSPDSRQLLVTYYPDNPELTSLGVVDAATGQVTALTGPEDEGPAHRDVPAGWLGQTAVYERTYPDRVDLGVELWRVGDDAPFWSMEEVQVFTSHPVPLGSEFLLATSAGWLAVDAGGGVSNLGPANVEERISEAALGDGMIAYASQGQLMIAPISAPGSVSAVLPYSGGGFDWSPDGTRLVIAGGASLTFVAPDGATVATLTTEGAGPMVAPYWRTSGILFVDSASAQLLEIPAPGAA